MNHKHQEWKNELARKAASEPRERITLIAPELHHIGDKPPVGGVIRFTDCSQATKRQRAYAGSHHTRKAGNPVGNFLGHWATVGITWAAWLGAILIGAAGGFW